MDSTLSPEMSPEVEHLEKSPPSVVEGSEEEVKEEGYFGCLQLNVVLPPEIWEQILGDASSSDFLSVINTCPGWNELLAGQKTTGLLPLVLPVLLKYLDKSSILKCRLITKPAKNSVDQTLSADSTSSLQRFGFGNHEVSNRLRSYHSTILSIGRNNCFYSSIHRGFGVAVDFLTRCGAVSEDDSPFLTNCVSVYLLTPSEPRPFQIPDNFFELQRLFTRFGHHISSLTIKPSRSHVWQHDGSFLDKLLVLLGSSPNIQVLKIVAPFYVDRDVSNLRPEQLPPLNRLVYLDILGISFLCQPLSMALIQRYGHQITTLCCDGEIFELPNMSSETLTELLPNVKKLRLGSLKSSTLPKLEKVGWKLDTLQIEGGIRNRKETPGLLQALSNFSRGLSHLQLLEPLTSDKPQDFEGLLESLPIMERMKILVAVPVWVGNEWFWEYVRGKYGNLEEIHLAWVTNFKEGEEICMRETQGMAKLRKIVLWKELPNDTQSKRIITR